MSRHTSGPWHHVMLGGGKGKPNEYSIRHEGHKIATVHRFTGNASANARLIATAPEMLEALKKMDLAVSSLFDELGKKKVADWGLINSALVECGMAIKKASGE